MAEEVNLTSNLLLEADYLATTATPVHVILRCFYCMTPLMAAFLASIATFMTILNRSELNLIYVADV